MRRLPCRAPWFATSCVTVVMAVTSSACAPDQVLAGAYGADEDASVDAASPEDDTTGLQTSPGTKRGDASAPETAFDAAATPPLAGPCDLSGRWLVTMREVATAIGSQEASHAYLYFELTQTGDDVVVSKGLHCGEDVRALSAVGASVDYPKAWPSMMAHQSDTGRKGQSHASGSGCQVSFEKRYMLGALSDDYADPSLKMPTASQKASGSTPGWVDWDQDENPGYTLNVTGLAVGKVYLAIRKWTVLSGSVAKSATGFTLPIQWDSEQDLLGYDGPSLLTETTSATVDSNASLQFAQFARLTATQANGDDATVCAAIRSLAPKLTPTASN